MAPPVKPTAKKKVPTWYYIAGGVVLVGAYYLYSKNKAAAAASAAAASPADSQIGPVVAAGSYGNQYSNGAGQEDPNLTTILGALQNVTTSPTVAPAGNAATAAGPQVLSAPGAAAVVASSPAVSPSGVPLGTINTTVPQQASSTAPAYSPTGITTTEANNTTLLNYYANFLGLGPSYAALTPQQQAQVAQYAAA